jgi:hypothetical protein
MTLSDGDIERYARQIIVPGVGAGGQARLLSASVLVDGVGHGVACARAYLEASGLAVIDRVGSVDPDGILVAGLEAVGPRLNDLIALGRPLVWYRIDSGRIEAGIVVPSSEPPWAPSTTSGSRNPRSGLVDQLLHHVAACDAAASVIAVLLDWETPERRYTKTLG